MLIIVADCLITLVKTDMSKAHSSSLDSGGEGKPWHSRRDEDRFRPK
jgi:hypothetical protein